MKIILVTIRFVTSDTKFKHQRLIREIVLRRNKVFYSMKMTNYGQNFVINISLSWLSSFQFKLFSKKNFSISGASLRKSKILPYRNVWKTPKRANEQQCEIFRSLKNFFIDFWKMRKISFARLEWWLKRCLNIKKNWMHTLFISILLKSVWMPTIKNRAKNYVQ